MFLRSHDADIRQHEHGHGDQIHRPAVMDDGQAQDQKQVREIEWVPAVSEHAAVDERVGPDLTILPAARDVDETDDEHTKRLPAHRHQHAGRVHEVIEAHVATGDSRACAERDREEDDREQGVPGAKDQVS